MLSIICRENAEQRDRSDDLSKRKYTIPRQQNTAQDRSHVPQSIFIALR